MNILSNCILMNSLKFLEISLFLNKSVIKEKNNNRLKIIYFIHTS